MKYVRGTNIEVGFKLPTMSDFSGETSLGVKRSVRETRMKSLLEHGFVSSLVKEEGTGQQHQSLFQVSRKRHRRKDKTKKLQLRLDTDLKSLI